jgi:hypothetical protein
MEAIKGGRACVCATHADGSVTTSMCPRHADTDPCLTMAMVTGRRRTGTIRRGVCTSCGHGAEVSAAEVQTWADGHGLWHAQAPDETTARAAIRDQLAERASGALSHARRWSRSLARITGHLGTMRACHLSASPVGGADVSHVRPITRKG